MPENYGYLTWCMPYKSVLRCKHGNCSSVMCIPWFSLHAKTQVAAVSSATDIATLLQEDLVPVREGQAEHYGAEQQKDRSLKEMIDFLQDGVLPDDFSRAKKLTAQESLFALVGGILYCN